MRECLVDARKLLCPMPVIRLQDQVQHLQKGDIVKVLFTDPGGQYDIPAWCRINGHSLIDCSQKEFEYVITLEVGE